jgi:hypothetical protein
VIENVAARDCKSSDGSNDGSDCATAKPLRRGRIYFSSGHEQDLFDNSVESGTL